MRTRIKHLLPAAVLGLSLLAAGIGHGAAHAASIRKPATDTDSGSDRMMTCKYLHMRLDGMAVDSMEFRLYSIQPCSGDW